MKLLFIILLFLTCAVTKGQDLNEKFSKIPFYGAMESGNLKNINKQLSLLSSVSIKEKEAFEGALLMRKAGVVKIAAEKLRLFKKGRIQFETALLKDKNNGEYHFLRLAIQENAPKIVKYKADLEKDKEYIIKSFKNLLPAVQKIITDYSKTSKILSPEDLKF